MNGMKIFLSLMVTVAFACIVSINGGNLSLEQKVNALEKQLHEMKLMFDEHTKKLSIVENKRASTCSTMYSFSTRLHEDTYANDAAVIFGTININVGDGYDEFTGVFHAPVSGLYLLSVYARTADDVGDIFVRKNDEIVCRTQVTGGNGGSDALGHDTGTCTGIAELVPEDSVRVTGTSDDPARIAAGKSGFIGHLIQPYC